MKIIVCILIIGILLCCFYGCGSNEPFQYSGNDVALYTEAIYSILGAKGFEHTSHGLTNPDVSILEEDTYGRILFCYYEGSVMEDMRIFLLISQRTEDGFVYYYPDYNFLILNKEDLIQDGIVDRSWWEIDQVEELKVANDWDQEIDLNKCIKQIVTRKKEDPLSKRERNDLYEAIYGEYDTDAYIHINYSSMDDEGKCLYLARNTSCTPTDFKMLIVDGDAYYSKKINNLTAYQEELAAFKREHNWKKS